MKRIHHEPAYVLHHYDWSESSLILEDFTRHHGRTALVAKGAKRPSSNFRPILLPLQPLSIGYGGDGEISTLKNAEWLGGHVMPSGDALLSGYYLNELLLRLLARDDPHPALFDAYSMTVGFIASHAGQGEHLQAALRAFEILLLREVGLLPALDMQTLSGQAVEPQAAYLLAPESGLRAAQAEESRQAIAGINWLLLQHALSQNANNGANYGTNCGTTTTTPQHALLTLLVQQRDLSIQLKQQLRGLLYYHCGVSSLRTRQLMLELQNL